MTNSNSEYISTMHEILQLEFDEKWMRKRINFYHANKRHTLARDLEYVADKVKSQRLRLQKILDSEMKLEYNSVS